MGCNDPETNDDCRIGWSDGCLRTLTNKRSWRCKSMSVAAAWLARRRTNTTQAPGLETTQTSTVKQDIEILYPGSCFTFFWCPIQTFSESAAQLLIHPFSFFSQAFASDSSRSLPFKQYFPILPFFPVFPLTIRHPDALVSPACGKGLVGCRVVSFACVHAEIVVLTAHR